MLDLSHIPSQYPNADVQVFVGNASSPTSLDWQTWTKPRGKTMCHILLIASGGNGGAGLIGANSLAGGGGGGSSGGQTSIRCPLWAIPDRLYIEAPQPNNSINARVSIAPSTVTNDVLVWAGNGNNGGNGTAVPAGGAGGTAPAAATATQMALGWQWVQQAIAGQAGGAGGAAVSAGALTLPTTGLLVTGGSGGGGLPAAATGNTNGGSLAGPGVAPWISINNVSLQQATQPAESGSSGHMPVANLLYFYGGVGGCSTHGSATGAGLTQSSGGNGNYGCGGGGSGAALTGSTAGVVGKGGPAICIITCW